MLQARSPKRSSPRCNSTRTAKKVTYNESKTEDSKDEMNTEDVVYNELSSHNDDVDCTSLVTILSRDRAVKVSSDMSYVFRDRYCTAVIAD